MQTKNKTKKCQNCKGDFEIAPEDFEFYKKIDVPEPAFCPSCRLQRRMMFLAERKLYKRKCDFSGKDIFSIFHPDSPQKVYAQDVWWGDDWDPMDYGRDYDFGKPFFEQIKEMMDEVPWQSRNARHLENSDYSMQASHLKNCYLLFFAGYCEDCAYGNAIDRCKDCYDNYHLRNCELCYQGFVLDSCFKTFFSCYCNDCSEVLFCNNCTDCSYCFGCANLRHKKYHIFNKKYSKEEYFEKLEQFNVGSHKSRREMSERAKKFWLKFPVKYMRGKNYVDVSGDYIENSKNVKNSYWVRNGEHLKFCDRIWDVCKDCYDYYSWGENASLVYETTVAGDGLNKLKFCYSCYPDCRDMEYCLSCHSSSYLFACIGLHKKQYCIFNKQYTKEQYEELVPKIKQHMNDTPFTDSRGLVYKYGEFFPAEFSLFGYNVTIAQEYFPLKKEEAEKLNYIWFDLVHGDYKPSVKAKDLPDHVKDVNDDVLSEVIECANEPQGTCQGSGVFRMIPSELKFYKGQNIPLPRLCPDCRHHERIKQRNPMKLHKRRCMCDHKNYENDQEHKHGDKPCPNKFETTYAPNRKEIIYCKSCYQREIE